jgi:hypothetical protein
MHITHIGSRSRDLTPPVLVFLTLVLALSGGAFAENDPSITQFGHNINVAPNQNVSELTCFGCSIRIRGRVAGDVTVFAGNIVLEDQAQVAGEVTAFGGDVRLDREVKVAGEVTVFAGQVRRDPQATISGDVTTIGSRAWFVPMLLFPFVMLGLLIALVVWVVQRARRPALPAAAA